MCIRDRRGGVLVAAIEIGWSYMWLRGSYGRLGDQIFCDRTCVNYVDDSVYWFHVLLSVIYYISLPGKIGFYHDCGRGRTWVLDSEVHWSTSGYRQSWIVTWSLTYWSRWHRIASCLSVRCGIVRISHINSNENNSPDFLLLYRNGKQYGDVEKPD